MNYPSAQECARILSECRTPEHVMRHCAAVAENARSIAKKLNAAGFSLNVGALYAAGYLHDCLRTEPNHASAAAELLASLGYAELAKLIAAHHDLPEPVSLDEAAILFYADKRVQKERIVTLTERFSASLSKCRTEEARKAMQARLDAALTVENLITAALGTTDF